MAQIHEQTTMTQDASLSEFGAYDAGWTATCRCGTDLSPNRGRATRSETQRAMDAHLARHGVVGTCAPVAG